MPAPRAIIEEPRRGYASPRFACSGRNCPGSRLCGTLESARLTGILDIESEREVGIPPRWAGRGDTARPSSLEQTGDKEGLDRLGELAGTPASI